MKISRLGLVMVFGLVILLCGIVMPVSADDNVTNATIPYAESEQYQQDVEYWYNYYTQDRATGYESTLRVELDQLLNSNTLSDIDRNEAILIKLGWDFRLENFMDETKRTIDEYGNVTYSLGVGNWWAKLFGNGTNEETLPQTMAEGNALYKIYLENYDDLLAVLTGESE